MRTRIDWIGTVLPHAAAIVRSYETGVTLRQLFYRLVSDGTLPNTDSAYKGLSRTSAQARREGTFPPLFDRTRTIHRHQSFDNPEDALVWLSDYYRRDRTEGQEFNIYLGLEKHGLVEMLRSWFGPLGIPIVSLGGYSSQSYTDEVGWDVYGDGRKSVLLYAGDFDPSGVDIPRDFIDRVGSFDHIERVALTAQQVIDYKLPPQPGKRTDSRAAGFVEKYGRLMQVEVDALRPTDLRNLFIEAIAPFWDTSAYQACLEREEEDRKALA